MTITQKFRDQQLDIAKGIAIILVVIGHVIQSRFTNFDEQLSFRVIYSFHMPLFIFLSGAVASLWFEPKDIALPFKSLASLLKRRISNSALRLLIPFSSWAIINNLYYRPELGIFQGLIATFRRPDTGLWFLLCIFYCVVLFSLFQLLLAGLQVALKDSALGKKIFWLDGRYELLLMGFLWLVIKQHSPHGAGLGMLKSYFLYYLLGIGFYKYFSSFFSRNWRILSYLVFISLVWLWSRVTPGNLLVDIESSWWSGLAMYCYAPLVAISGIFVAWDICNHLFNSKIKWLNTFLAYCGKLSLGIYAVHAFFIGMYPLVIAPLFMSLLITSVLLQIRIARLVLLGEK